MGKVIRVIVAVMVAIIMITVTVLAIIDDCGKYECIDMQGNEIICTSVQMEKSGAWGITKDGRRVQVISYKKVGKGE